MTEALSVSLRLPFGAVVQQVDFVVFALLSSFFFLLLSLSLTKRPIEFTARSTVGGDVSSHAFACDVKTIVRNAHRACLASFL